MQDDDYTDDLGYYLCYPESRRHLQALNQFRDWILHAVAIQDTIK